MKTASGDLSGRHIRRSWSLPLFATLTTMAFVLVSLSSPYTPSATAAVVAPGHGAPDLQSLATMGTYTNSATRDAFSTSRITIAVTSSAPAAGVPDPGTAQAIAYTMLQARGMGPDQYSCLVSLWDRESHWNLYASNPSSGAYGIPQALPGNKMASAGADWATNPATQISWGLGYIEGRYATPCGAWAHSEAAGWY